MQKKTDDTNEKQLNWGKIQKNLDDSKQDEQMAWTDTEEEDGGVERQKTPDTKKPVKQ